MLRSRLIPTLLIDKGRLVKTTEFAEGKYVGDPLNTVRIFNEKRVDELFIADISASSLGRDPDFSLLGKLAGESRMPLTYAGGVSRVEHFNRLVSLGVEKVAVGAAFIRNPGLVAEASQSVGRQSVSVVVNSISSIEGGVNRVVYDTVHRTPTTINVPDFAARAESEGAGEIILYSVDRDGSMRGFDIELIESVKQRVDIPLTLVGGASNNDDLRELSQRFGPVGIGAGSIFVFTGKFRSVLIQYPSYSEKLELCVSQGRGHDPISAKDS